MRFEDSTRGTYWRGLCIVGDEGVSEECRIVDFSHRLVHILLRHEHPELLMGSMVQIQFPSGAVNLRAHVCGRVRSAVATDEMNVFRLGIELASLSRAEQALAIVLEALTRTPLREHTEPPITRPHLELVDRSSQQL